MRPLVVISSENEASQNIKSALLRLEKPVPEGECFWKGADFDMAEYDGSIVEIVPKHDAGCYIFASTHKSGSGLANFTAHTPGNWGAAELGGSARTLNIAYGSKIQAAVQEMKRLSDSSIGWPVGMEVDHHGPCLEKPVLFVEIGSGQAQWGNEAAGEIAAKGVLAAVRAKDASCVKVCFGGTHYCPKFGPLVLFGKSTLGHIISGYSLERDGVDEERLKQAMGKNFEGADGALLDWKGIKGETRGKLIAALESLHIKWEKA